MENAPEFYPLLYGIWRAGLSAVPMNSKLHAKEMAWILARLRDARLCLASPKLGGRADGRGIGTLPHHRDGHRATTAPCSATTPSTASPAIRRREAWLFYTSGTTGRPKGAMLTPPQPAVRLPVLLRRHRLHRPAGHDPARRAADARLGPVRPAALRARRLQRDPGGSFDPERVFDALTTTPTSACSPRRPWSCA